VSVQSYRILHFPLPVSFLLEANAKNPSNGARFDNAGIVLSDYATQESARRPKIGGNSAVSILQPFENGHLETC
jgi:hypothetical protein